MVSEKLQKIIIISDQAYNSYEIEVWTHSFKARGTLLKDPDRISNGIVTLKNARIVPIFNSNQDSSELIIHEWLNIFEEQIVAFTVINPKL